MHWHNTRICLQVNFCILHKCIVQEYFINYLRLNYTRLTYLRLNYIRHNYQRFIYGQFLTSLLTAIFILHSTWLLIIASTLPEMGDTSFMLYQSALQIVTAIETAYQCFDRWNKLIVAYWTNEILRNANEIHFIP